ncbi:hypothetical protein LY76DRAFT_281989 [Colletotrichum caudatum]|nr:hypothetical protein LY76DRAFT_281989 [Colletotrichum caudatum]
MSLLLDPQDVALGSSYKIAANDTMSAPSDTPRFAFLMVLFCFTIMRCPYVFSADPTLREAPDIMACLVRARVLPSLSKPMWMNPVLGMSCLVLEVLLPDSSPNDAISKGKKEEKKNSHVFGSQNRAQGGDNVENT